MVLLYSRLLREGKDSPLDKDERNLTLFSIGGERSGLSPAVGRAACCENRIEPALKDPAIPATPNMSPPKGRGCGATGCTGRVGVMVLVKDRAGGGGCGGIGGEEQVEEEEIGGRFEERLVGRGGSEGWRD